MSNGVTVTYWVLDSATFMHLSSNKAILTYLGYLDESAYNDGKAAILDRSVEIDLSDLSGVADALNNYSYDDLSDLIDTEVG